jgi:RND family efflux transporter MFP subunit
VKLQQEQAEAAVARAEWEEMNPGIKPDSPLTLREPQIEQARAELVAAKARLENARLNLRRTHISVPFDGRILEESVDVGQSLRAGQAVATMYGSDSVEIAVPLEDAELAWIDVPQNGYRESGQKSAKNSRNTSRNTSGTETKAEVMAEFAAAQHRWTGRVVRAEGQIDTTSRMVHVVVEVDEPFTLTDGRPPLVPGMFVDVEIHGRILEDVVPLPRHLIHEDDHVWIALNDQLSIRPVHIARLDQRFAYITSGLDNGDLVIISALEIAADGMRIQAVQSDLPQPSETADVAATAEVAAAADVAS